MVLYLQIFNKQNNFLFILAEGLFLKNSYNFANFSLDVLINYMLIKIEKECNRLAKCDNAIERE